LETLARGQPVANRASHPGDSAIFGLGEDPAATAETLTART